MCDIRKCTFICDISWLIVNETTIVVHAVFEHLVFALIHENALRHVLLYLSDELVKLSIAFFLFL
jgi:hypothetical protein